MLYPSFRRLVSSPTSAFAKLNHRSPRDVSTRYISAPQLMHLMICFLTQIRYEGALSTFSGQRRGFNLSHANLKLPMQVSHGAFLRPTYVKYKL